MQNITDNMSTLHQILAQHKEEGNLRWKCMSIVPFKLRLADVAVIVNFQLSQHHRVVQGGPGGDELFKISKPLNVFGGQNIVRSNVW